METPRRVRQALSGFVCNAVVLRSEEVSRGAGAARASELAFVSVTALLFLAAVTLTIFVCGSSSAMGEMAMPGGWSLSMMWMRMPGQSWFCAAGSFTGAWSAMMVAMMLPSLTPMLRRYRGAVGIAREPHLGRLTAIVGAGYFFVWTMFGLVAFPLGSALATAEMRWASLARATPIAVGAVVALAGLLQSSKWKAHHLSSCRLSPSPEHILPANANTAWRHGVHLGLHCGYCCAALTAVLFAIGIMDLRAMTLVGAAVTIERLASNAERVARAIGVVVIVGGLFMIARAATLG